MTETSEHAARANDESARIRRIPAPIASPGQCVICGKSAHPEGFAVTDNLDFEFYGTVYFCADCVGDYARAFGYLSPSDFVDLRTHMEAQDQELRTLRQAVLTLENTVDSLSAELSRRSSSNPVMDSIERRDIGVVSSPVDEPDEEPASVDTGESVIVPEVTTADSDEPVVEQGPDDLYDTSSADRILGL